MRIQQNEDIIAMWDSQCIHRTNTDTFEQPSSFPVSGPWSVRFATPVDNDSPGGPVLVFDSVLLSWEERRIKISMGELRISNHVHGDETWDTLIADDEPKKLLASDEKVELLLKLLLPITLKLTRERSDILWTSMEIQMNKMSLTYQYAVEGVAEVETCIINGLSICCCCGVDQAPCIIKAPAGFTISGGKDVVTFETVAILFASAASMRRCFRFILSLVDWLGIAVQVSTMTTSTTDGGMSGIWTDIARATTGSGACAHLSMSNVDGTTVALSGFSFDINGECTVAALDTFYIPGICSLSRKVIGVQFSLSERTVVKLSAVHMILLRNLKHRGPVLSCSCFPCLELLLDEVVVEYQGKIVMQLKRCSFAAHTSIKGFEFDLSCDFLESRMISSITSSMSGCFTSNDVLSDLRIRPGAVSLITDIRTFDWSLIRPSQENTSNNVILNIPLGIIESFSLSVDLQNAMVSTEKPHVFPSFQGGPNATTDDFGDYVVQLCVKELPRLYTKTCVMGERATDLTAKAAGRLASSSVAFSALGSISALVLTDAVRALSKQTFFDNVMKSVTRNETNAGDINHGHFQTSVLGRLKQYVDYNRKRFGSAAGSALGIAIGTALYGLPGMMIGNILGGNLAAAAIGQFPTPQDATRSIVVKEDASCEWVLVGILASSSEGVADEKYLQSREIVYPRQDIACPSAPWSLDGSDFEGPQGNNEDVPAYLQPANSIDASLGNMISLQKFFAFVRRHPKKCQWRLHKALQKNYQK